MFYFKFIFIFLPVYFALQPLCPLADRFAFDVSVLCGLFLAPLAASRSRLPPTAASSSRNLKCCQCCHPFVCLLFKPWLRAVLLLLLLWLSLVEKEKKKLKKRRQPGRMSSGRVAQCRLFVLYPWSDNCQLSPVAAVSARGPRRFVYVCVAAPAHWQRKQLYHGAPWMLTSGCCPHCACACAGATQQTVAAEG